MRTNGVKRRFERFLLKHENPITEEAFPIGTAIGPGFKKGYKLERVVKDYFDRLREKYQKTK